MTPEFWKEIEAIFELACEMPPGRQEAFVSEQCAGRPELKAEVEKLLRNADSSNTFLESPVWTDSFLDSSIKKVISNSFDSESGSQSDFTGMVVGPYKLVTEIGRGGMGTVYRAERVDGEFTQEVAVKLLKRGLDSDFIVKRFRHERQILASFEHPFISRLLDGGTTPDGLPFFVMEFIRGGVSIFDWCDSRRLDLSARLRLFIKVCSALEYAHERKIVHRDIKPGNILVNRSGAPKLLDFGIAKILDPDLIHESFHPTASLVRMMTPDYASPEQIRGLEITPSSDIYSMGVLLFELCTGHRPYKLVDRDMKELSAVICDVATDPPSRALLEHSTLQKRYSSAEAAVEKRGSSFEELTEQLEMLDPIILRALEKEPDNRFASITEFSEEISQFLKGGQLHLRGSNVSFENSPLNQRSMAVLPFRTILFSSGYDTTDEHFLGVGLADALIARLSRIHKFLVLPTTSVSGFRERTIDPIKAGRQLNADYILDGSIKMAGDRLRLSVQLLDVKANAAIWATSIDERVGEFAALEQALSEQLIEALVPRISSSDLAGYSRRGTESAEAFEHYLRGRYHFSLMSEENLAKSFVKFHEAIAVDPKYAHPYCGIANYYNWLGVIGVLPPSECFRPAIDAAQSAVQLEPNLSEAHASLGFSLHVGLFDWERSDAHFQRAIELNPGNANAYLWYSTFLFMAGNFERGFEYAYKAAALDPLSPYSHYNIASGLYYARRFKEAEAQHQKVVDEFPEYGLGYYGLGKIHRYLGKTELAIEDNRRAGEMLPGSTLVHISTAEAFAAAGKVDEALSVIEELQDLTTKRFVSPYMRSLIYTFLGDNEKVIELLQESLKAGEAWLCCLPVEARFEKLFDDDRFQAVLTAVNHPLQKPARNAGVNGNTTRTFGDLTTVLLDEPF